MGTTGLIFGAVAVAWLAYLIPMWLRRTPSQGRPAEVTERFSDDVRIVRSATTEPTPEYAVSTPLTRRAAYVSLRRREGLAAGRRRLFLILIAVALVTVSGLAIGRVLPAWTPAVPVAALVLFVWAARVSVRSMAREREELVAALRGEGAEDTVVLGADDLAAVEPGPSTVTEVRIGAPQVDGGAPWEAVPVTSPTYVQTPTPPRTVRTIDLSPPPAPKPVTADPRSAASAVEVPESLSERAQRVEDRDAS